MKLIRALNSTELPARCALTMGNFDAVHRGHRAMLQTLADESRARTLPAVVMTFDPHPQEYFAKMSRNAAAAPPPARLTTTATRFFALRECGADIMLSLKFNRALAQTAARDFVRKHLVQKLGVKYLLVGDDFRFGAARAGDFQLLADMARQYDYELGRVGTISHDARRVSSSWVRELLQDGQLQQAARLLGDHYAHVGRVIHGARRGGEWGFPTINLAVRHRSAVQGIFAVRVTGLRDNPAARLDGVASLGTRPTIHNTRKQVLEVHLFAYRGDAYGRRVRVEFIEKIRDEEKFASIATLKHRIGEDLRVAKTILQNHPVKPS